MTPILLHPVIELLAKASLVLASGLLLASMRRVGPALRHTILFASVSGALALSLCSIAAPRWDAPILPSAPGRAPSFAGTRTPPDTAPGAYLISGDARSEQARPASPAREITEHDSSIAAISLFALWLLGLVASLARILVGRVRLHGLTTRAWLSNDAEWIRLLEEEKTLAGVSKPVGLLVSPAASTPMTWGTRRPVVLLPEDALQWTADHLRIVLRHELAHITRRDALMQSIAAITCAVYWLHPLALMAAARMRTECEHACDDRVLALGTGPTEYASHLLDVARAARDMGASGLLSLAMARTSQLERRLLAVLDWSLPRTTPTCRARVAAVSLPVALSIVGSAFHPVPRTTAQPAERSASRDRVTIQSAAVGRIATPTTARARPVERVTSHAPRSVRDDFGQSSIEVLLRASASLANGVPVHVAMTRDENLVLINETTVHPLDLRAAIELVKQIRAKYGRDIPGGVVQIPVSYRAPSTNPSDAEPYEQLLARLHETRMEALDSRRGTSDFVFYENADVELAVTDSTLARLMKANSWPGR